MTFPLSWLVGINQNLGLKFELGEVKGKKVNKTEPRIKVSKDSMVVVTYDDSSDSSDIFASEADDETGDQVQAVSDAYEASCPRPEINRSSQ